MTAPSPAADSARPLRIELTAGGETVDTDRIVSIETWSSANRIPRARIAISDGQADGEPFPMSGRASLAPGSRIEIAAGYGSRSSTIHAGTVIRQSLHVAPDSTPQLVLDVADKLLAMTLRRSSALSLDSSDSDIIAALVGAAGGSVGRNDAASAPHEAFVQFEASDWDLMLMRAEAGGCLVLVEDGKAEIVAPESGEAALRIEYGEALVALDATIDAPSQIAAAAARSRSWSYAEQALKEAGGSASAPPLPGDLDSATLAGVFGLDPVRQQSGAAIDAEALGGWSSALLARAGLARVRGAVRFQGSALAKPGATVTLAGLGERFGGDAYLTGVRHVIRDGRWQTVASFGAAEPGPARSDTAPAAAGLAAPARGLHTGVVKAVAADPAGDFRVKIALPLVDEAQVLWARLGHPYASSGFGIAFHPEVGDEVAVAFMDEDPANPVIVASLYSRTRAPTYPANEENDKKAVVTRSKMEITFDDKDVVLEIRTPGKRIVRLDDKDKKVRISDPFGNSIEMTEAQVEIVSGKAMRLKSGTDLSIDCGASMSVKAAVGYALKAPKIEATADAQLAIASNGVGELKAAGPLTISGALVKIN